MRIMTWNINSLRLRMPLLRALVDQHNPDIVCLQETKVTDALFPREALSEIGFSYQHFSGMKSYNGVAILSRTAFKHVHETQSWCNRDDCRHVAVDVTLASGPLTIQNFYVPAGGDVADPTLNPKFAHKLSFLDEVRTWFAKNVPTRAILMGDLNVAPLEHDVWSHRQMRKIVSHTEPEVSRLNAWLDTGFFDAMRAIVPESEKLYTWWSYRNRDWAASNRGRRLDHIWLTHDLRPNLAQMDVLKQFRGAEGPSDHVPVFVDLRA